MVYSGHPIRSSNLHPIWWLNERPLHAVCSAPLQNPCVPTLILPQRYLLVEQTARPSSVSCFFGPVQEQAEPRDTPLDSSSFYSHLHARTCILHLERSHRRVPANLAHICTALQYEYTLRERKYFTKKKNTSRSECNVYGRAVIIWHRFRVCVFFILYSCARSATLCFLDLMVSYRDVQLNNLQRKLFTVYYFHVDHGKQVNKTK